MKKKFRSFEEARKFVHSLNLKNQKEWLDYCKSGKKPDDIPAHPAGKYKKKGWEGFGNWIGTGRISNKNRKFLEFIKARNFARSLGLKSEEEWINFCKLRKLNDDIPRNPAGYYK